MRFPPPTWLEEVKALLEPCECLRLFLPPAGREEIRPGSDGLERHTMSEMKCHNPLN